MLRYGMHTDFSTARKVPLAPTTGRREARATAETLRLERAARDTAKYLARNGSKHRSN